MQKDAWQIYMGEIPHSGGQPFWVSFESDPKLVKTRANIYGRCLPCIQNLYFQLQAGREEIELGNAFNCWKVTAVLKDLDQCLALLANWEAVRKMRQRGWLFFTRKPKANATGFKCPSRNACASSMFRKKY
ncbi:MAG: hypothetical protein P8Y38_04280 [Deltaproteobacteria bacterium]